MSVCLRPLAQYGNCRTMGIGKPAVLNTAGRQPALILILGNNSCCQDNFILLLTQERRSILQTSRDVLDPYMRSFQVRVASLEWQVHILTCFFALF